jgi:hypothetical protein
MEVSTQVHAVATLPMGIERPCALDRRFGGPQNLSVCYGEQNIFAPAETRTPVAQLSRYTD